MADREKNAVRNGAIETEAIKTLVILLAPFAPHIAEELWHELGQPGSVHKQPWPQYDPAALVREEVEIVVQVNGKVRSRMMVPAEMGKDELEKFVLSQDNIQNLVTGKQIMKVIGVPTNIAAVATIIIRFCTLWFGVAVGLVALAANRRLLGFVNQMSPAGAGKGAGDGREATEVKPAGEEKGTVR